MPQRQIDFEVSAAEAFEAVGAYKVGVEEACTALLLECGSPPGGNRPTSIESFNYFKKVRYAAVKYVSDDLDSEAGRRASGVLVGAFYASLETPLAFIRT